DDYKVDALDHQPTDVSQSDVAALNRVVQPPVRILLYSSRFAHTFPHYGIGTFHSAYAFFGRYLITLAERTQLGPWAHGQRRRSPGPAAAGQASNWRSTIRRSLARARTRARQEGPAAGGAGHGAA